MCLYVKGISVKWFDKEVVGEPAERSGAGSPTTAGDRSIVARSLETVAEQDRRRSFGCSPNSQWRCAGACVCTKPRFDVDGFGRLYIPHAITFKVSVRDNSGNEIVKFGGYGNYDCQGPESKEPKPAIPMGWPVTAGASDKYIYVGDCLNHRIVRTDKTWASEEIIRVK